MSIEVLSPGPLTTVQDRGRTGWRHLGIGIAGALDDDAHQLANLLVGNPPDAATLEITLAGPRLRFAHATRIAVCGADVELRCDGTALSTARPLVVPAGAVLSVGGCRRGTRAYLAVAGGVDVPPVLGSRSTDLRGGFGGLDGRALRAGDVIPVGIVERPKLDSLHSAPWWIDDTHDAPLDGCIRMLPGADATTPVDGLLQATWRVGTQSDRQGLRLEGPRLVASNAGERISAPVAPGTVQLPPDGQPIVLLADAQTHGGYPRIGHVTRTDLSRLAQLRPGDTVRFATCTPVEAHAAACARRQTFARLALMIELQSRSAW